MSKQINKILFFLTLLVSSSLVMAADLSSQQVGSYIDSMPQAIALSDKYAKEQKRIDPYRPLSSSVELMGKDSPSYKELSLLAKNHHFKNVEEWADVGDRVMRAYMVIKMNTDLDTLQASYDDAVKSISAETSMSEAAKKGTLKGMEKGYLRNMKMVESAQPDLSAVKPHIDALDVIFD